MRPTSGSLCASSASAARRSIAARMAREADYVARIGGVPDRLAGFVRRHAGRKGAPGRPRAGLEAAGELGQTLLVGEIEPSRVHPVGRIKVARRGDLLVWRSR